MLWIKWNTIMFYSIFFYYIYSFSRTNHTLLSDQEQLFGKFVLNLFSELYENQWTPEKLNNCEHIICNILKKYFGGIKKMNIVRYDPFRELRSLQDEVNRLFSSIFSRSGAGDDQIMRGAWNPSVDIFENQNSHYHSRNTTLQSIPILILHDPHRPQPHCRRHPSRQ